MPLHTEFTADGRGVLQTVTGVISVGELIADLNGRQDDPVRIAQRRFGLIDFSGAAGLTEATAENLHRLIAEQRRMARFAPRLDLAVIAPSDLIFGVARMWEGLNDELGWSGCVVRTRAEALEWLRDQGHGESLR
jgi:hypothetical protein